MKLTYIRLIFTAALLLAAACSKRPATSNDARGTTAQPPHTEPGELFAQAVPGNRAPTKRALLVGLNRYKYPDQVSPLEGSINDVEDVKALLIGKFEFPSENVLVLKDEQATHAGIIAAIQNHLIAPAQKDDIVVFDYSGHGSQMQVSGNKISGMDETLVPYDSRDPAGKVFDISGSELHGLLQQLAAKTKNITFILDSCHSGTLIRGDRGGLRVRGISADVRKPPAPPPNAAVERGIGQIAADSPVKCAFIAAATSRESAFEHYVDGKNRGALSYYLCRQLRMAGAGVTYRDVMDSVTGNVTASYPAQHPQLEGVEADQFVFGDGSSVAQNYVMVSPIDAAKVSVAAGDAFGASLDSIYDVYKPGTKKFSSAEKPIARVQLTTVGPFASEGKAISGAKIAQYSRGIERDHRFRNRKLRIYFDHLEDSAALQAIKAALPPQMEAVGERSTCNLQVRETAGKVLTLSPDAITLSPPIASNNSNLVDRVMGQLKGWAKWFNLLSISNPQPDLAIQFTIKASQTRDPFARIGKPDAGVREGESIDASIRNNSSKDLYVSILDLSSDGSISLVYPSEQGASEVLQPGATFTKTFTTFVPIGRSFVTDILKVFASSRPIPLAVITSGPIREVTGPDPLNDLLQDAYGMQRGIAALGAKPVSLGGWTTAQRVLFVRRKT